MGSVLLVPVSLMYGWYFFFSRIWKEGSNWRNRTTFFSLLLVSLATLMWPVMALVRANAKPINDATLEQQLNWGLAWGRVAIVIFLLAFILGLMGRPRLILPIAVACIGTGLFWILSVVPF